MLKTGVRPFRSFRDSYAGARAIVIGSGPAKCDYSDLISLGDPIFFLNDSIFLPLPHTEDHFFFTYHIEMKKFFHFNVTYLWQRNRFIGKTLEHSSNKIACKSFIPVSIIWGGAQAPSPRLTESWIFDKDYVAKTSCLVAHGGSLTSVLHFLWYCGFTSILGVGIEPTSHKYHDPRILKESKKYDKQAKGVCSGLSVIIPNQLVYMDSFGFAVEYG